MNVGSITTTAMVVDESSGVTDHGGVRHLGDESIEY